MPHIPIAHQLFAANCPRVGLPLVIGRDRPFGVDTKKGTCDVPDPLCSVLRYCGAPNLACQTHGEDNPVQDIPLGVAGKSHPPVSFPREDRSGIVVS